MSTSTGDSNEQAQVGEWLGFLFDSLEEQGLTYATLRFDASLCAPDCELDILVHPSSLAGVVDGVRELCIRFPHINVAHWNIMPRHAAAIVLVWLDSKQQWRHYRFDIRCGIRKQHSVLLHGSSLRHLTVWDVNLGTRRLKDEFERALLIVRNALDDRAYKQRHNRILRERSGGDANEAMWHMGWRFEDADHIRVARTGRGWARRTTSSVMYLAGALYGRICRSSLRTNVVIYGPDGVGKSTQAQLMTDFFRAIGVRRVHTYHHLVEVSALKTGAASGRNSARVRAYRSATRSWAQFGIVTLSYLKKLFMVVFRLGPLLRRGHVVVHDRYLLDVFQKFYKTRGTRFRHLEHLLSPITPREPLVVVLEAMPDLVSERTGELTSAEAAAAYRLLFDCLGYGGSRFEGWVIIDASQSIDEVHNCVVRHVLDVQTRRVIAQARSRRLAQ